ncbi:MAG: DUF354 domain-containing protein [Marinilabilia sp.]
MRIFLDIGHPAHVHYFRNFIKIMESRGHQFLITARDRAPVPALLEHYDIPFINRGKGSRSKAGKIFYFLITIFKQIRRAMKFRPDLFLDFSTMYSGPAAFVLGKPYITFTDTEYTMAYRRLIRPFSQAVYTPECFTRDLGKQHHRFNGLMELAALHPRYFEPSTEVLDMLGLRDGERFAVVRFIGRGAWHDHGRNKFSEEQKIKLVGTLQQHGKVFISAEGSLPPELEPMRLNIPPHQMHHLLFYATLLAGESVTMTSEAAVLGTPSVYISRLRPGYLTYLEKQYGLVMNYGTSESDIAMAVKTAGVLMGRPGGKSNASRQSEKILEDHIDVTQFMIETIENWHA